MAKYSYEEILQKLEQSKYLPLIYCEDELLTANLVEICYQNGVRAFEFTHRGPKASFVFEYLMEVRAERFPEMALGIGSIINEEVCSMYIQLGADFIVAPIMDEKVGVLCMKHNVSWIPGCGTLTEVVKAKNYGALLSKVFPGSVLGPDFIKSVLAPCPDLKLMPTGGVQNNQDNLNEWFNAGAFCVGLGSQLFTKEIIQEKNYTLLADKLEEVNSIIQSIFSINNLEEL